MSEESVEADVQVSPVGLAAGTRYKCEGCGNLTRFDVRFVERGVRFWHAEVSGEGRVDATEEHELDIESVTCRWCGSADRIIVERAPIGDAGAATADQ